MSDTSNTLKLTPGTRFRTGGKSYEVTKEAKVNAGMVVIVPQKTRLLKVYCETCRYTARITNRWIEKAGTPECPSGHGRMTVQVKTVDEASTIHLKVALADAPRHCEHCGVIYDPSVAHRCKVTEPEPESIPVLLLTEEEFAAAVEDTDRLEPEPEGPSTLAGLLADL